MKMTKTLAMKLSIQVMAAGTKVEDKLPTKLLQEETKLL